MHLQFATRNLCFLFHPTVMVVVLYLVWITSYLVRKGVLLFSDIMNLEIQRPYWHSEVILQRVGTEGNFFNWYNKIHAESMLKQCMQSNFGPQPSWVEMDITILLSCYATAGRGNTLSFSSSPQSHNIYFLLAKVIILEQLT